MEKTLQSQNLIEVYPRLSLTAAPNFQKVNACIILEIYDNEKIDFA